MIIVRLYGGLGNQFFQYATARSIALQNNTCVALDLGWFDSKLTNQTYRTPQIHHYQIHAQNWYADTAWLERFIKCNKYGRRIFLCLRMIPYLKEEQSNADVHHKKSEDLYLDGYWQNYQYFENIKSILQDDLRLNHQLDEKNQALKNIINQNESVCLHVRRGDYVSNPLSIHHVLDLNYYQNAISYISSKIANPFFYIFSDDPHWCKENFNLERMQATIVEYNVGINSYKDLELMKQCKHYIIANSTFSWWAAWLGSHKNSIVIAPNRWLNNSDNCNNLIPKGWLTI